MEKPGVLVVAGDRKHGRQVSLLQEELDYVATPSNPFKTWSRSCEGTLRLP
jgi:hypothetical protein